MMPTPSSLQRKEFIITGQVQGVGFRPFVYGLATALNLSGFVRNTAQGVEAELQGSAQSLVSFSLSLCRALPPLARIATCEERSLPVRPEETAFTILPSLPGEDDRRRQPGVPAVLPSPDTALCSKCFREMNTTGDRRYQYAFTNCTDCGPRYTIIRSLPYDRASTSMSCFPLCPRCRAEYETPDKRRFHAQPNACPECGPKLWFVKGNTAREPACSAHLQPQETLRATGFQQSEALRASARVQRQEALQAAQFQQQEALQAAAALLVKGGILAIKGLGGFHLACNAFATDAVLRLRAFKRRPTKALAVMVPDPATARQLASVTEQEASLLSSPEHPIVLCRAAEAQGLAPFIFPDNAFLGLMLPYTPLHHALFFHYAKRRQHLPFPCVLVMTSGNPRGEPLCQGNREALQALAGIADGFLLHDRDIVTRVDDSVLCHLPERGPLFFRRSRGYAPNALNVSPNYQQIRTYRSHADGLSVACPVIMGMGAEQRATCCLLRDGKAFVSQYIGDLDNAAALAHYRETADHLAALLALRPERVVCDRHPDYMSSALARESGLPMLTLQHHFAHAHALLAEHPSISVPGGRPVLVLALDGAGLGDDGSLWGGEALLIRFLGKGNPPEHQRLAHFAPLLLPGGEAAVREPWRIAHGLMHSLSLEGAGGKEPPWLPERESTALLLPLLMQRGINTWQSTSCGRLFDAVSALLGLCLTAEYDGQPAMRLEECLWQNMSGSSFLTAFQAEGAYPCPCLPPASGRDAWLLDTHTLFAAVWRDWTQGAPVPAIAARFHKGLAQGLADLTATLAALHGAQYVGLTGGCLQNRILTQELAARIEGKGLIPLMHSRFSPNDECISLGQAVWGSIVTG